MLALLLAVNASLLYLVCGTMSLSATGNYTRRVAVGVEIPSDDIEKDQEALPTHFSDDDVVEFSSLRKHNRIKKWFP